ncbi:MAG: glycosyltransferase family 9 protein [Pseudomonadota bacterium]
MQDPKFGNRILERGKVYLVYDELGSLIMRREWGRVAGDGSELNHFVRSILKPQARPLKLLFVFHGGLGDAVSLAALLVLLEREYNFQIDIACRYEVWFYILVPMGFRGKRLDFPLEMNEIGEYEYIQTDATNFFTAREDGIWEESIIARLSEAYRVDVLEFRPEYSIPAEVMNIAALPGRERIRIGLSFESKGRVRAYPDALANQVISLLLSFGFEVFHFGTGGEKESHHDRAYHCMLGRTGIFELAAFLRQMDFFISMDSFPAHLANVLGVKSLVLLSTTGTRTYQFHRNIVCMASKIDCAPCGEVMHLCPKGFEECKAFFHESISPELIVSAAVSGCRDVFSSKLAGHAGEQASPFVPVQARAVLG